jgi:hypothetical protein
MGFLFADIPTEGEPSALGREKCFVVVRVSESYLLPPRRPAGRTVGSDSPVV